MTSVLHDHYTPPDGFDFEYPSNDMTDQNKASKAEQFVQNSRNRNKDYGNTNQVLVTMGTDFRYRNAENWYKNMDKLITEVGSRYPDVDLFYSTPNCYFYFLNSLNKTFSERSVDYLTYWTGYYSNRPSLKYQDRLTNNILQVSLDYC